MTGRVAGLRALLAKATHTEGCPAEGAYLDSVWCNCGAAKRMHELLALAPEVTAWAADAAEELEWYLQWEDEDCGEADCPNCKQGRKLRALLARLPKGEA